MPYGKSLLVIDYQFLKFKFVIYFSNSSLWILALIPKLYSVLFYRKASTTLGWLCSNKTWMLPFFLIVWVKEGERWALGLVRLDSWLFAGWAQFQTDREKTRHGEITEGEQERCCCWVTELLRWLLTLAYFWLFSNVSMCFICNHKKGTLWNKLKKKRTGNLARPSPLPVFASFHRTWILRSSNWLFNHRVRQSTNNGWKRAEKAPVLLFSMYCNSQCRGLGSIAGRGTRSPCAATKDPAYCNHDKGSQINKY